MLLGHGVWSSKQTENNAGPVEVPSADRIRDRRLIGPDRLSVEFASIPLGITDAAPHVAARSSRFVSVPAGLNSEPVSRADYVFARSRKYHSDQFIQRTHKSRSADHRALSRLY